MRQRYFTVEEATALLPRLTALLTELRERRRALLAKELEQQERYRTRVRVNGHARGGEEFAERQAAIEADLAALNQGVQAVTALGVELKDIETGLVDFPSWREGRVVYLCWRLGEPTIAWWHEVDAGFAGRQPL
ncbi:MAG: DUF2203 domain-containing protein [Chloroflexi bacterium]|jgi:hypothetical protein|nr:DUF2203 domain-containing protein [Chloroflexota bacterium]